MLPPAHLEAVEHIHRSSAISKPARTDFPGTGRAQSFPRRKAVASVARTTLRSSGEKRARGGRRGLWPNELHARQLPRRNSYLPPFLPSRRFGRSRTQLSSRV